jgi:hypothetical protein
MSNPFTPKGKPMPVVSGNEQIVSEGVRALEGLPTLIESLGDDAGISEIQIWENMAITASIWDGLVHAAYAWNGERWVKVTY